MFYELILCKSNNYFAIIFPSLMALIAVLISGIISYRINRVKYKTDFLKDKMLKVFDQEIRNINLTLTIVNLYDKKENSLMIQKYVMRKIEKDNYDYLEPSYWLVPDRIKIKLDKFNKIAKEIIFPDFDKHKQDIIKAIKDKISDIEDNNLKKIVNELSINNEMTDTVLNIIYILLKPFGEIFMKEEKLEKMIKLKDEIIELMKKELRLD